MAILRLGNYTLDHDNSLQHTFARMSVSDGDNFPIKFHCNGGADNGKDLNYPAFFYDYGGYPYKKDLPCDETIAKQLICWSHNSDNYNRTVFNRSTDSADLLYSVTGVCHQMCNTVIVAIRPSDHGYSLCNCVPSLGISMAFYGKRGLNWGSVVERDKRIREFVSACTAMNTYQVYNGAEATGSAKAAFNKTMDEITDNSNAGLSHQLNNGYDYSTFNSTVGGMLRDFDLWDKVSKRDDFSAFVKEYLRLMNQKNDYDNSLVRGQVRNEEYAAEVNKIMASYQCFLAEYLEPGDYLTIIGQSPDALGAPNQISVIDKTAMPDTYEGFREKLKLR